MDCALSQKIMRHKEDKMQNARHGRLIGVSKRINAGRRNFLFNLSGQETLRLQICYCEIVTAEVSRQEVRVSVFMSLRHNFNNAFDD